MYNKNSSGKISSLSEDKQEQNKHKKQNRKKFRKLEMISRKWKFVIMNKNCLETNENKRNSLIKKVEKGKKRRKSK